MKLSCLKTRSGCGSNLKLPCASALAAVLTAVSPATLAADTSHNNSAQNNTSGHHGRTLAIEHAPIGVMGDHTHNKGEFMFSYRVMRMEMKGSRDGTDSISPAETATSVANPFAGRPMQPPTLRVVPTEMSMTMHMLGLMYAPSDTVTLMLMVNLLENEMDHTTFQGGMGDTELGNFTTKSSGLGDTRLSALTRLASWDNGGRLHSTFGVSIPTGDRNETDQILTPMGTRPEPRLPYPMQLGSGTWDLLGGLTYVRDTESFSYGGQWQSLVRLGENSQDYTLGDEHRLSVWYARALMPELSLSARVAGVWKGKIDGADPTIVAPVQTADPDNQGGTVISAGLGANAVLFGRHRVGLEWVLPLHRDLNGPQLETDWELTLGYQLAF